MSHRQTSEQKAAHDASVKSYGQNNVVFHTKALAPFKAALGALFGPSAIGKVTEGRKGWADVAVATNGRSASEVIAEVKSFGAIERD